MKSLLLVLAATACSHATLPGTPVGPDAPAPVDAAPDAPTEPPHGAYVVIDRFDGIATDAAPASPWLVEGDVAVREVPFAANKSAAIAKTGPTGVSRLSTSFTGRSGRTVFEADVMARETAGFKAVTYIYDDAGNTVASIGFQDGAIKAHTGGAFQSIGTFRAGAWYRVRVAVDTAKGTFDLYVDGVRLEHGAALRTPAAAVSRVAYYLDGVNTGTLFVDNVRIYSEAEYIGAPPQPIFDVHQYGAVGNGTTDDTAAIQAAIAAAAGTGGSVVLAGGTFLAGSLTLQSKMTFFVDGSATLLGRSDAAAYPTQTPATGNTQLHNCQRSLLYASGVDQLVIDGGGTIDGQGDSFSGAEATRPMLIWPVLSTHVTVRNLYLRKGAVWGLVSMESDHVVIDNVVVQSNGITHDGIDIVDGSDVTVDNAAVNAGDDAMCLKSGVRRGLDGITVAHSMFTGNNGGSNGIKIGTGTYGAIQHIAVTDTHVKDVQYAAMAVESRQGSDLSAVAFDRVTLSNTGAAFFVYLAQQATTHPVGDVPKLGSIDGVAFTDISGSTASWPHSPHQGSLITGHLYNGTVYPIRNLTFRRVAVQFTGGATTVPGAPVEAMPDQYPESNMFGDLPAWAYYLRHVENVTFDACTTTSAHPDPRPDTVNVP